MRQSEKRRRSLADFKEIDDALGNAFLEAEQTKSGSNDINFNGAISAKVKFSEILHFYYFLKLFFFILDCSNAIKFIFKL